VDFQFRLIDLTHQDDRELHGWLTTDLGKLVALCLKHAPYDAAPESRLRNWLELLGRVVRSPGGVAGLNVVSRYLLERAIRARLAISSQEPCVAAACLSAAQRPRAEGNSVGEFLLVASVRDGSPKSGKSCQSLGKPGLLRAAAVGGIHERWRQSLHA
jgi:hypothetical protein